MQGYSSWWAPTKHSVAHVQEPEIDGLGVSGLRVYGFRSLGV